VRWSRDGKRLALNMAEPGSDQFVVSVAADGGNLRRVSPTTTRWLFSVWSPDGAQIASLDLEGAMNLLAAAADGTKPLALPAPPNGLLFAPASWSPDGRYLLGWNQGGAGELMVYEAQSKAFRVLNARTGALCSAEWLPDSRRVVYCAGRNIHVLDVASGRDVVALAQDGAGRSIPNVSDVTITADGRRLFYMSNSTEADVVMLEFRPRAP
jgi:Tol biopolymer transport system component